MATTYIPLYTTTLASAASSVTISSISQAYTDLVLITSTKYSSTASHCLLQLNADSATNYSNTFLYGDGSSAYSGRQTSNTGCFVGRANTTEFGVGITHIQNYSNSTTFKTVLSRGNLASSLTIAYVGLWRNTNAVTSLTIAGNAGDTFAAGSTFSLYGVAAASVGAKATGGTIYSDADYFYHAFTSSGTFTPLQSLSCDVLVVAGGGGGGATNGAGGGAGGVFYATSQSLTATGYTCTVGAGGTGGTAASDSVGTSGTNSTFASLTAAVGGGYGAKRANAANGGSGGGGNISDGITYSPGTSTQTSTGGTGYGNAGGVSISSNGSGGGGGSGAAGSPSGANNSGGAGGVGTTAFSSWVTATNIGQIIEGTGYIAGGGGAGADARTSGAIAGAGGYGGGGSGSGGGTTNTGNGISGTVSTGGGGGGGGWTTGTVAGGNGGSGLVIVRYPI